MKGFRVARFELSVLVLILVVAAFFGARGHLGSPVPAVAPQAPAGPSDSRAAPAFSLPDLNGQTFSYPGRQGPVLIILSAVGCSDCRQRVPIDHKAVALAKARGLPVWNMLVYSTADSARDFVRSTSQTADRYLVDNGSVAVGLYHGSDVACWILIDAAGRIAWQGRGKARDLEQALTRSLGPVSAVGWPFACRTGPHRSHRVNCRHRPDAVESLYLSDWPSGR